SIDGKIIRITLPELRKERRQEFVMTVKKMTEDARVAIRHVRRDTLHGLKAEQKKGDITEDDLSHAEKEVQKLTDEYIKKIDAHLAHKEEEIMKV
ncbi:MAG: ribosome-recycling factor, partial [Verrucomicrobiia bacterium]